MYPYGELLAFDQLQLSNQINVHYHLQESYNKYIHHPGMHLNYIKDWWLVTRDLDFISKTWSLVVSRIQMHKLYSIAQ